MFILMYDKYYRYYLFISFYCKELSLFQLINQSFSYKEVYTMLDFLNNPTFLLGKMNDKNNYPLHH